MPKPKYLVEQSREAAIWDRANKCCECRFYGTFVKKTRARREAKEEDVFECAKHPKCLNTRRSLACSDWEPNTW